MSLEFNSTDKENISWSKIQINTLISQYKEINSRLWTITLMLWGQAVSFAIAVIVTLLSIL